MKIMNDSRAISETHYAEFMKGVTSGKHKESVVVSEIAIRHCILEAKALKYFKSLTHPLAKCKEYWILTQEQYISITYDPKTPYRHYSYEDTDLAKEDHEEFVKEAIIKGLKVSADVLKDYPHLNPHHHRT